jgi:hypothetical protein
MFNPLLGEKAFRPNAAFSKFLISFSIFSGRADEAKNHAASRCGSLAQ